MALRKEAERRYQSATQFAQDIQRYFDDLPITARKESWLYTGRKFLNRHKPAAIASCTAAILLVATVVGVFIAWRKAERSATQLRQAMKVIQTKSAFEAWNNGELHAVQNFLKEHNSKRASSVGSEFELRLLDALFRENRRATIANEFVEDAISMHVMGKSLAMVVNDTVVSMDLTPPHNRRVLPLRVDQAGSEIRGIAFDNLGQTRMTSWNMADGSGLLHVTDRSRSIDYRFETSFPVDHCIAFSPDGRHVAGGGRDGSIYVWNTQSGSLLWQSKYQKPGGDVVQSNVHDLAFSPDGRLLASTINTVPGLVLWNIDRQSDECTVRCQIKLGDGHLRCVAISHDGAIVVGGRNLHLLTHNGEEYVPKTLPHDIGEYMTSVAFLPDGNGVAYGTEFGTLQVRDIKTWGVLLHAYHDDAIQHLMVSTDGETIVSVSKNEVKACNVHSGTARTFFAGVSPFWNDTQAVQVGSDLIAMVNGATMANGDEKGNEIEIWNPMTGQVTDSGRYSHEGPIAGLAYSDRYNLLAATGRRDAGIDDESEVDREIRVWNLANGRLEWSVVAPQACEPSISSLCFDPWKKQLLVGAYRYTALWDIEYSQETWRDPRHDDCYATGFSTDGQLMVTAGGEWWGPGFLRVWDTRTSMATPMNDLQMSGRVTTLDISRDNILVVGDTDGVVSLFDLADDMRRLAQLRGHSSPIATVAFHPNGKRVVSGGWDRLIKIWNVPDRTEVGTIKDTSNIGALRFVRGRGNRLGLLVSTEYGGKYTRIHWLEDRLTVDP